MRFSTGTKLFWSQVSMIFVLTMIAVWGDATDVVEKNAAALSIDARVELHTDLFVRFLFSWIGLGYAVISFILVMGAVRIVELLIEKRLGKGLD